MKNLAQNIFKDLFLVSFAGLFVFVVLEALRPRSVSAYLNFNIFIVFLLAVGLIYIIIED